MSDNTANFASSTSVPQLPNTGRLALYTLFGVASVVGSGAAYFFLVWRRKQHTKKTRELREAAGQPQAWAVYTAPNGQNLWYPVGTVLQPGGVPLQQVTGIPMPFPPPGVPIPTSVPVQGPYPPGGGGGGGGGGREGGYVHGPQLQQGMYGLPDHSAGAAAPGQVGGGIVGAPTHEEMRVDPRMPRNDTISLQQGKDRAAGVGDPTMPWNELTLMPEEQETSTRLRTSPVRADFH
ncbi:hypothetical protein HDU87_003001 [Geranomyces variabilis]|uniref:Gram-positive cocci surface proteins LPxTG domain-containing protein n=1 Tax=Geranomyces variabilis TaxID=109894 RepID=A0AAD5TKP0_9FUNG|nr:hypothetical protein HDU87_003001 [Geranomyces variabilis]